MKKEELEKKIDNLLDEKETFILSLMLLAHMNNDEKYHKLSDLIFLFDNYKGFKQFIKYYEGQTIQVPTYKELKQALRLLCLFQKVYTDKLDFEDSYYSLHLDELGLDQETCKAELAKFYDYLVRDGHVVFKHLKKLSKIK